MGKAPSFVQPFPKAPPAVTGGDAEQGFDKGERLGKERGGGVGGGGGGTKKKKNY